MPQNFRQTEGSVMVFGEAAGETDDGRRVTDVVWVWRLSGDSIASVDAFQIPRRA